MTKIPDTLWQGDYTGITQAATALPPGLPQRGVEVSLPQALQPLWRHFAGLERLCALLKLGPAIFLVSPCPAGGVGLSGKTCP